MSADKIRIVACTLSLGQGNGIAAMDNLLWSKIDRDKFDLTYCYTSITDNQIPPENTYHVYVPLENRYEILKNFFLKADIVQFNGGFDPVVCDAARISNVPIVVEIMHQCERGQRMQNIDITVCVSESVQRFQPNKNKTLIISNGIDIKKYNYLKEIRDEDRFVILQVSRKNKKMHFCLSEVAEEFLNIDSRIEIWIVGAGFSREESHKGRLKKLGVSSKMQTLYQKADVMLLASVQDAFGLACVEAMASGCIPIVSADGAMDTIVDHEKNGWLLYKTHIEYAKKYIKKAI
ncbi:glycosyltransferase family 4 protein [Desulfonatronum thiodismutans]|uniref:glycosyltransferase family 4 protein n=1 Tax=Desulfonatronum thiodismutans TaxID=159290 RepID=UPI0004ABECDC|nr:glycosyltransferase family 4 protein [Desulfonatronum thiodismutans]